MAAITKRPRLAKVLNRNLETAKFFMEIGMHCLGCPASPGSQNFVIYGTNTDMKLRL